MALLVVLLLAAALLAPARIASAATPLMWHRTGSSPCADDGHIGAPTGTPQYASFRADWASPPTCLVPGVGYAVGPDPAAVLRNPETASFPPELFWNATEHRLECSGGIGTSIHDLDFSLVSGGSGSILVKDCTNVTISNVKVVVNCNDPAHVNYPIRQLSTGSGIAISKTSIDQGGLNSTSCGNDEAIFLDGAGIQSVTYTLVLNAIQHNITFNCSAGQPCSAYAHYDAFVGTGWGQGQHPNIVQFSDNRAATDIGDILVYSPQPSVAFEQALHVDTTSGSSSVTLNFYSGPGGQTSLLPGMTLNSANLPANTKIVSMSGPTNPLTAVLDKTATATASNTVATIPNAYPFGNAGIRYVSQNATAPYPAGVFRRLIFYSPGPIQPGSYGFVCNGGAGTETVVADFSDNFISPAGFQGSLFTTSGGCPITHAAGNKRLDTGAPISVP